MLFFKITKKSFLIFKRHLYSIVGSFIIVAGWNWYHLAKRPHLRFVIISCAMWVVVFVGYQIGKWLYAHLVRRFKRHPYWYNEFYASLDKFFFVFSLLFLVFFIRWEWLSVIYVSFVFLGLFWVFDRQLRGHPNAGMWRKLNATVFLVAFVLFAVNAILQYTAYAYYIFDAEAKFYDIVIFRAWTMTMVWMIGFALASLWFLRGNGWLRYMGIVLWSILLAFVLFVWMINVGNMYFSGLYFGPISLEHSEGTGIFLRSFISYLLITAYAASIIGLIFLIRHTLSVHRKIPPHNWKYHQAAIIAVGIMSLAAFSSFKTTPEVIIAKSFYDYFKGNDKAELKPYIFKKLERFGLFYDLNAKNIVQKNKIFESKQKLLPKEFDNKRPNIIIVFLESFSSRLTSVYDQRFKKLTPGLEQMAADPHTTKFSNYYNASTPTITGLMSQLCSFLPPTGHQEFEQDKKIKKVFLYCLPQVLKDSGYKYTGYVTAVDTSFANKGTVFESMGTDEVYGTTELSKLISGEPLAWGYSDHQMFPAMEKIIQTKAKSPFLMMISTVDTHPPFNVAKDMVQYKNSRSNVLNSFHTTDDAFRIFWNNFISSSLYDNTIVVAVADHAVFPTAITKDIFPQDAGKVSFYDENTFLMYIPNSVLPKEVDTYASGIDFAPTILQILGIDVPNAFEGHPIFDDRAKYPNLLGMHEFGLYINQLEESGTRKVSYNIPSQIVCKDSDYNSDISSPLTLCEFLDYYKWKRKMFEEGRFWYDGATK